MQVKKVGVLVGSLRKESFSRKIAKALEELATPSLQLEEVNLENLEMYNQDFDDEGNVPSSWTKFRDTVKKYDAILFITPEYNRSVPALLKNALDIGSRPYGKSVWDKKPGAVVSVSPGRLSAFGANHHLRQSLVFLNVPTMQQPEAYIGDVAALLDDNGVMTDVRTLEFLKKFLDSYAIWVEKNL
ncbi:NADPH-dependent FMN reductase [[Clostridium] fimetarium]|uniref:Chromate reductase n=1 Tax=[Clostridium] fimetarium TaxID=99656 RepID=A0A1I0MCJ9_9FIRM|nr:NAD(P)H-dependent oxidoreductase [[Clostridium] fimetarium]SEV85858.1 chromate reductase [[Clostridium] fimetarium]